MIGRWSLLALLALAARPVAAQNPIVRVQLYTNLHPQGLDTALMDRPTWGVIRARVIRQNGQVDTTTAVKWRTQDSTMVRLRRRQAQSVAIESPTSARLGRTRVIVDIATRHDTIQVVVRNGLTRLELDHASYQLAPLAQRRLCTWMVTRSGGRILTSASAAVPYCVQQYPNR
jgi:hypothetical protein